jgi:hypothetical protein
MLKKKDFKGIHQKIHKDFFTFSETYRGEGRGMNLVLIYKIYVLLKPFKIVIVFNRLGERY